MGLERGIWRCQSGTCSLNLWGAGIVCKLALRDRDQGQRPSIPKSESRARDPETPTNNRAGAQKPYQGSGCRPEQWGRS